MKCTRMKCTRMNWMNGRRSEWRPSPFGPDQPPPKNANPFGMLCIYHHTIIRSCQLCLLGGVPFSGGSFFDGSKSLRRFMSPDGASQTSLRSNSFDAT